MLAATHAGSLHIFSGYACQSLMLPGDNIRAGSLYRSDTAVAVAAVVQLLLQSLHCGCQSALQLVQHGPALQQQQHSCM